MELSDRLRSLLEEASDRDEVARRMVSALAEDDYVPALQALVLELSAVRSTIEGAVVAMLEREIPF